MAFLIREIIWFLLLTAVLWGAIGWWLRSVGHRSAALAMEQEHQAKLRRLTRSRDDYRDQLEQVAATTKSGNLTTSQRSQIAAHIGKLEQQVNDGQEQVARLTAKLEAVGNTARARDEEYGRLRKRLDEVTSALAQRDDELLQMRKHKDKAPATADAPSTEATTAQLRDYKHSIARLNARIESLSRQQQEPMAALEHTKLLDVIQAQKKTIAGMINRLQANDDGNPDARATAAPGQNLEFAHLQRERDELARANQQIRSHNDELRRRLQNAPSPNDTDALRAQLAERDKIDTLREQEQARLRQELAELRDRSRAQSETIAALRARGTGTATRDTERDVLMQAMREQERTIVTLKEQLRESVRPTVRGARSGGVASGQPSGDLFATPPTILLEAPEGKPDPLQKIHGVGPVLEAKLNELGIFHFRQIAALSQDDIGWIASKMNAFPNRIVRDRWVSQAAALTDGGQAQAPIAD